MLGPRPSLEVDFKGAEEGRRGCGPDQLKQRSKRSGNRNNGVDSCDANGPV